MRGKRYGGSSIRNGSRLARSGRTVRDRSHAAASDDSTLNRYMPTMSSPPTSGEPEISAPMMSVYTGSRAEHVISGITIIVRMRSRRRSIVRVAMIAGIAHAKPDSIGTNARPCRFIDRMMRSIRYAIRAR